MSIPVFDPCYSAMVGQTQSKKVVPNSLKVVWMFAVRHAAFFMAVICGLVPARLAQAQPSLLLISGLPCPGGQGEPANGHPLIWNCLCATEKGTHHDWVNWQDTVAVHYGDV